MIAPTMWRFRSTTGEDLDSPHLDAAPEIGNLFPIWPDDGGEESRAWRVVEVHPLEKIAVLEPTEGV